MKVEVKPRREEGHEVWLFKEDKQTLRYILPIVQGFIMVNPYDIETKGTICDTFEDAIAASINSFSG